MRHRSLARPPCSSAGGKRPAAGWQAIAPSLSLHHDRSEGNPEEAPGARRGTTGYVTFPVYRKSESPTMNNCVPPPPQKIIHELTVAYWASRCLQVIAELGIADLLGDVPQSAAALARTGGLNAQALHR